MKAYLEYRPSGTLRNSHIVATGSKLPVTRIEHDRYSTIVNTHAVEVEMADITPEQRSVLVGAGEVKYEIFVGKLAGAPKVSTPSDIPAIWHDTTSQRQWDTIPTVSEWLAEAQAEREAAEMLLPELRAAQAKWFARRTEEIRTRIEGATSPTSLWELKPEELRSLADSGIDTTAYRSMISEWETKTLPELSARQAESNRRAEEYTERQRIEAEAAKAQAEADKLAWCAAHGSPHLAQAVAAGYDCTRLYATERAAVEYPGYVLDYKNNAEWTSRSCPTAKALTEALAVNGEVVWLKEPPRSANPDPEDYWDDSETYPCEAVVISSFLGKYNLIREI